MTTNANAVADAVPTIKTRYYRCNSAIVGIQAPANSSKFRKATAFLAASLWVDGVEDVRLGLHGFEVDFDSAVTNEQKLDAHVEGVFGNFRNSHKKEDAKPHSLLFPFSRGSRNYIIQPYDSVQQMAQATGTTDVRDKLGDQLGGDDRPGIPSPIVIVTDGEMQD